MIKLTLLMTLLSAAFMSQARSEQTNPLVFGNNRITLITDGLVRLEYAVDGKFHDDRTLFAWNRQSRFNDFKVTRLDQQRYIIETPRMKITYKADGYPFGAMNFNIEFDNAGHKATWTTRSSAFASKKNLLGAVATLDQIDGSCPRDEGLLARDGYYMIDDTGKERIVDEWIAPPSKNHVQDYYVFIYGDDYRSALRSLGEISGYAPMNRKYMHGTWYCRFYNYNADDYRQIVNEYKQNNYPLDVLVFDMDWHTMNATIGSGHGGRLSWTGYTWNKEQFPNPKGLIEEFNKEGIVVPLNDHPADGLRPHEEHYSDFMSAMGLDPDKDKSPVFDASSKNYMTNFFKYALEPNEKIGCAFWWLDWQQNYIQPYVRGTKMQHLQWLNKLYYDHSLKDNLRGAVYSRWGGWGSQRYPIQFSGDSFGSWPSLAFQVELTATSGNAGCFFWAHDIGGHYNGGDPQMYVRWTQFGAMSSTLRVHSAGNAKDRRMWLWGDTANEAMRRAYHLRSQLMPYIYSSLWQTHTQMLPLNRAMYIDYPRQEKAYENPQQFLFGDNILVAPITSPGEGENMVATQKVWFPQGDSWFGWFDNKEYMGGSQTNVQASIYEFPLFVKGGHPIPMQPYTDRMGSTQTDTLIIRAYRGRPECDNSYTLHEDDGMTLDYTHGKYATTKLGYALQGEKLTLTVAPTEGSFAGQKTKRVIIFELMGASDKFAVKEKKFKIKPQAEMVRIVSKSALDISKGVAVVVESPY